MADARVLLVLLALLGISLAGVVDNSVKHARLQRSGRQQMMKFVQNLAAKEESSSFNCLFCTMGVDGIQELIRQNSTDNEIAEFLINLCDAVNLEQPHVCKHIILSFQDEVVFVLERTVFTPHEICGAFVKNCGSSVNPFHVMWNITIPGPAPPTKPWPKIPANKPTVKMLQLSDIHIDRQYAVGSEAYCQLDDFLGTYAMCCRNYTDGVSDAYSRAEKPIHVPAGKWGMPYACDLPYDTFVSALKHISTAHKDLDYIIITGDFEAHDSWDYTEQLTKDNINNVTADLLKYFPKTPIYVSIGNHEGVPQDAMAPHTMDEYSSRGPQWLYTIMKDMWANWIPTTALPDVQYRASYAVYPKPGLKLISINTIYCSGFNFYLYINQTDPDDTLKWLIQELLDSETKGEMVHLISHIPPGDDYCLKGWSHNFFAIVQRFQNIIAQQFYGHTHYDHFQVYYEESNPNKNPFHFNWITPSITTYNFLNPTYRIFTIDGGYTGATWRVSDVDTYSTDVEAANKNNKEPVWALEYNHKKFYNMTEFSPQAFSDLSDRLWNDKELFRKFVKLYWRNDRDNECYEDYECRHKYVCELKKAKSYEESYCAELKP